VGRPLSGPLEARLPGLASSRSGPAARVGSRSGSYVDGAVALEDAGGRLSGTIARQEVDLSLALPASTGGVAGAFAGSWRPGPTRSGLWSCPAAWRSLSAARIWCWAAGSGGRPTFSVDRR